MVFDDSTAAIDAGTEQRIRAALRSHGSDRVTIIIAHRLGSLMHADRILFLEDGEIVERGTHAELLALGGRYRALHDLQLTPTEALGMMREQVEIGGRDPTSERGGRPPRAVVGSTRIEEEIFGRAFDGQILGRIWAFVRPYRPQMLIAVAAVLTFTATQLAIPLIIRHAIDRGMGPGANPSVLAWSFAAFAVAILVNYAASWVQETVVGRAAENVLSDMRRAMFAHLQRVSLSASWTRPRSGG